MLSTTTRMFFGGLAFLEHAAAVLVGLVLIVVGLALGVTMLMLPVGVVIGLVGVLLVVGGVAFLLRGADAPGDPHLAGVAEDQAPIGSATTRTRLPGFGEIEISVENEGAPAIEACLLLADQPHLWAQGLMGVTDPTLGGYDGMVFLMPNDAVSPFYMRNTPQPLSVVFFDAGGEYISEADMEPCGNVDNCTRYPPDAPYRWAIEVPQGGQQALGLVPDSKVTLGDHACT